MLWPSIRMLGLGVAVPLMVVYVVYNHWVHSRLHFPSRFTPSDAESNDQPETFTRHIVAVGDLHGDLPNAERVLRFSGVVDDFGDWSGHVDVFVQTGDIIDR